MSEETEPMPMPENEADPGEANEQEGEVDHEALQAYVDSCSPAECHELLELLKAKVGEGNKKMTMKDFSTEE